MPDIQVSDNITLKEIPHYNVVITTPGHSMLKQYTKSLAKTIQKLEELGITWTYQSEYTSIVATAREATIAGRINYHVDDSRPGFGEYTYDKLFMIDSDIEWEPEAFLSLYYSDKDIVSGCYSVMQFEWVSAFYKFSDTTPINFHKIKKEEDLVEVQVVGLGFCCVKKGVFESIRRPWFFYPVIEIELENGDKMGSPNFSEDAAVCHKWVSEGGFQIWLDPKIRVIHNKTYGFNLDFLMNQNPQD